MDSRRTILWLGLALALLLVVGTVIFFGKGDSPARLRMISEDVNVPVLYTRNSDGDYRPLDFTQVAANVTDAVVHIRASADQSNVEGQMTPEDIPERYRDFFGEEFFRRYYGPEGGEQMPSLGSGSGVIIEPNGYIVTNNHVIANASEVEVMLNDNRSYEASVVGADPSTDLALLKIEANRLPTIPFFNSDRVRVGEWVLAVGNPFNLNSTVTAGIVSAKGRSINILNDQYAVESFIQTDAAINPGNSGGALVNLQGGLVGINTAIASPTGAYSGYGFAVPSNLVRKVVSDLLEYGFVQRGYLGVTIRSVNSQIAGEQGLDITQGVLVDSVLTNSAAGAAGIQVGDVIVQVNGRPVNRVSDLQERIAGFSPGDKVSLTVVREGQERTFNITLLSADGRTALAEQVKLIPGG